VDQVNSTAQKAWKALHFVMLVLKKGNRRTRSLAYTSLVRPVLEHGSPSFDPWIGQIKGGSNMTGTDLYVNKPHCAAAVRP